MNNKPKVIKDYEKLPPEIHEQIKLKYPHGYHKQLISFKNREGKSISALPFETEEKYYLVRMTVAEARAIVREDEDFDEDGMLKNSIQDEYSDKYGEVDFSSLDQEIEDIDS